MSEFFNSFEQEFSEVIEYRWFVKKVLTNMIGLC